jgi:hypothetical protein
VGDVLSEPGQPGNQTQFTSGASAIELVISKKNTIHITKIFLNIIFLLIINYFIEIKYI